MKLIAKTKYGYLIEVDEEFPCGRCFYSTATEMCRNGAGDNCVSQPPKAGKTLRYASVQEALKIRIGEDMQKIVRLNKEINK